MSNVKYKYKCCIMLLAAVSALHARASDFTLTCVH